MSQPTLRREGDARAHGCVFQGRKASGVTTNVYSRKMSEKSERCGLRTLIVKGWGVVFTHGEGSSTPHVRHKGRQPLIECARHNFKIMYFPLFYVFMYFPVFMFFCFLWAFLYLLSFCSRQGCFPHSYVSTIAMRKSDLRSSFRTKRWLSCFDLFPQDRF